MKTLLLLRHAKSDWDDASLSDHDRPLAPRGVRAAGRIAAHLRSEGIEVDVVLCSSARRTRETLDLVRTALGDAAAVRIERWLYGADPDEIVERLRAIDPHVSSVLVIGHNPGLEDLALELAGDGNAGAMTQLRTKFPTCALATLDIGETGWDRLGPGVAYLTSIVLPRDLEG